MNLHPPKTNIAPENGGPLEKEIPKLETIILGVYVSFRGCIKSKKKATKNAKAPFFRNTLAFFLYLQKKTLSTYHDFFDSHRFGDIISPFLKRLGWGFPFPAAPTGCARVMSSTVRVTKLECNKYFTSLIAAKHGFPTGARIQVRTKKNPEK